ncbi:ABC transporter substrate-binding protein [Kaistia dalseonensis]|uniref:Multiple sugar transport system substrate-binding protein n=1 Tax=Kaistia dalseonensis TaxID=410840 RepID=A0ABU0H5M7_9HYPH|nr:ABC transporter substrate-binding protein [Kaistia dalseonensis]MCX5494756.1 ABC transporter substrate-binding protein [Kaistia dalseonensis]MDQ0437337.1 multiple sugar transport system substrate-binding protein [Kaistia dalseonensis]
MIRLGRVLGALGIAVTMACQPASAQPTGEISLMNWLGGADAAVIKQVIAGFEAKYPDLTIKQVPVTTSGDQRGGIRTALLGGQKVDLIINAWPAFRKELADAGMLRDVSSVWTEKNWDSLLSPTWRELSTTDGAVYGVPYIFGYRSGIWHEPQDLTRIGLTAFPADWNGFTATFEPLRKAGFAEPVALPGKIYGHSEWFESLLLRVGGPEVINELASHKIKWTDERLVKALQFYSEMMAKGCCADIQTIYASHWDDAADRLFVDRSANYLLIGMWINARARSQYHLEPGKDYALGKFPAFGLGHDDDSLVDSKEVLATNLGANAEGADLFLDYLINGEGAGIIAKAGFTVPTSAVDISAYDPVAASSVGYVKAGKVHFVLGDMLPGQLVDEYRVALQKFIANPVEAQIMPTLEQIEAVAAQSY